MAQLLLHYLRMSGHYPNGMDLLTAKDAERIPLVTACAREAFEIVQPDGLRPPGGDLFEPSIDLSRAARLGRSEVAQNTL